MPPIPVGIIDVIGGRGIIRIPCFHRADKVSGMLGHIFDRADFASDFFSAEQLCSADPAIGSHLYGVVLIVVKSTDVRTVVGIIS